MFRKQVRDFPGGEWLRIHLPGIKTQTQRMDLRTRGGGRVSWDEVREWHGHIYTTKGKTDS